MPDGVHALTTCGKNNLSRSVQSPHDRAAFAQERDNCHTMES
jgi:hypothetical protein